MLNSLPGKHVDTGDEHVPNKTVALIAHDGKKDEMVAFALSHKDRLLDYDLVATATTGHLLEEKCGLTIQKVLSGPLGGDAQIAAMCAEGKIEAVFFFMAHWQNNLTILIFRVCSASATFTISR